MAKRAREFTAVEVRRLVSPGHHCVGGIPGLYLYVNDNGARSWVLRVMVGGRRRHVGLGSYPEVVLAEAREKARVARTEISNGIDPVEARKVARAQSVVERTRETTFREAAHAYIDAHALEWKSQKHRAQWDSTLERYAYPVMGSLFVRDITQDHVISVIKPIWKSKNETASRLRGRIESILAWAAVRKLRSEENPARWKGHLDKIFAAPSKVQKVVHHRALPLAEMQDFMRSLRLQDGIAARALEFCILCAARSGEVRGAQWAEFDLAQRVWVIPKERMKAKREHRVPLGEVSCKLLEGLPRFSGSGLVFPSPRSGKELSDMTLTAVLRRMKVDAVPHGFRSTFRDWVGEKTDFPSDLAELALAHVNHNKTEAAYRRADALERRRVMMENWALFCKVA